MKRWIPILFLGFCVYMIAKKPHESAGMVSNLGGVLMSAADGFGTFITSLTS